MDNTYAKKVYAHGQHLGIYLIDIPFMHTSPKLRGRLHRQGASFYAHEKEKRERIHNWIARYKRKKVYNSYSTEATHK